MATKGAVNLKLEGHVPANRDAVVRMLNTATGERIERKPFLDGTLTVRDIDPGAWEVEVIHPNLVNPVFKGPIRVLPQLRPTFIPIPIPSSRFEDNPIRDVPDADLTPVQQTATAVRSAVAPLGAKAAGEVIRAEDWNQLASAVSDLAGAVLELTRLVSPRGHDHPEIASKIDEVQGNLRRFIDSFGRSLLELRRDIESQNLRRTTTDMLDAAGVVGADRDQLLGRVADLELSLRDTPLEFTRKLSTTGTVLAAEVNRLAVAQGDGADAFLQLDSVKRVMSVAEQLSGSGTQIRAEEELDTYRRTGIATGGSKFNFTGR
jgi:hypothetical protein